MGDDTRRKLDAAESLDEAQRIVLNSIIEHCERLLEAEPGEDGGIYSGVIFAVSRPVEGVPCSCGRPECTNKPHSVEAEFYGMPQHQQKLAMFIIEETSRAYMKEMLGDEGFVEGLLKNVAKAQNAEVIKNSGIN